MKFIHIADVHLGMVPDAGYPWSSARAEEMWKTLGKVVERCNEDQIDLLFVAGDLFHRQPLKKELKETCLMQQTFVKDNELSVAQYVEKSAKELGKAIKVKAFVRYEVGEGIEKKVSNLAEEVAAMNAK